MPAHPHPIPLLPHPVLCRHVYPVSCLTMLYHACSPPPHSTPTPSCLVYILSKLPYCFMPQFLPSHPPQLPHPFSLVYIPSGLTSTPLSLVYCIYPAGYRVSQCLPTPPPIPPHPVMYPAGYLVPQCLATSPPIPSRPLL